MLIHLLTQKSYEEGVATTGVCPGLDRPPASNPGCQAVVSHAHPCVPEVLHCDLYPDHTMAFAFVILWQKLKSIIIYACEYFYSNNLG